MHAHFPASGPDFFERLRHATAFHETADLREEPVDGGRRHRDGRASARCRRRRLEHPVEAFGYRLVEPDGRRMLPERLAAHGIAGPASARCSARGGWTSAAGP